MPTNHPYAGSAVDVNVFIPLSLGAFLFGTAILVVDVRAGAPDHRAFLLVVGFVALALAVGLAVAAVFQHRRTASGAGK